MDDYSQRHHARGRFRWAGESVFVLRNGDVVELRSCRGGDFDVDGNTEEANTVFDLLSLFDAQHYLLFLAVVGVAQVKFRRARPVQPLAKELVDVGMRGLFDGLGEIGGALSVARTLLPGCF